jgi:hypothetical protein
MTPTKRKRTGAHFTPPGLAFVVAEKVARMVASWRRPIRILDPACGDGNLLLAIAKALPADKLAQCTLIGIEDDEESYAALRQRHSQLSPSATDLIRGNFLDMAGDGTLFGQHNSIEPVDVIIANPPYVRTQVLGAATSQNLAGRFNLSGRVDLYQAFLVAMSRQLLPGGAIGVITSNRFLTTRGGLATRRFLMSQFHLTEIVDLGDTKLFEAAVLPALVFGYKRPSASPAGKPHQPAFVRIYENVDRRSSTDNVSSVLELVRQPRQGHFSVNGTTYQVAVGELPPPKDENSPWTMLTSDEHAWIERVRASSVCRVGDVAKIRVGIKTTADQVFIRRDWQSLPDAYQPDKDHLKPLLSQEDAAKWRKADARRPKKQVLYTHEVVSGKRRAIAFKKHSSTWKYLLAHRPQLESRDYVIGAGRQWYEIWVPQDPRAWAFPKIVFPDISPTARFFLDRDGSIVDGNCYWVTTLDPSDDDLLLFILGLANSRLMGRYHELAFQNRLYSQRRRFLTQYVQEYPLPCRDRPESREVVSLVRKLTDEILPKAEQVVLESEVDRLVAALFGVSIQSINGHAD